MPQSLFEHSGLSQGNSAALYEIWAPANSHGRHGSLPLFLPKWSAATRLRFPSR